MAVKATASQIEGGAIIPLGSGATYYEPRISYVRGEISDFVDVDEPEASRLAACGPGTFFPLEVTRQQLEEILYRARDSRFTAGKVTIEFEGKDEDDNTVPAFASATFSGAAPPTPLVSMVGDNSGPSPGVYQYRGYNQRDEAIPTGLEFLMSSSYSVDPFGDGPIECYDILDGEYAMWRIPSFTPLPPFTWPILFTPVSTGLSHNIQSQKDVLDPTLPSGWHAFFWEWDEFVQGYDVQFFSDIELSLNFYRWVAFVDVANTGNPFSAGNRLFMSMEFTLRGEETPLLLRSNYNDQFQSPPYAPAPDMNLVIALESGDISVPLHSGVPPSGTFLTSSTDIRIEVTKWWPYKTTAGDPAWNATTGAPANGGPGA